MVKFPNYADCYKPWTNRVCTFVNANYSGISCLISNDICAYRRIITINFRTCSVYTANVKGIIYFVQFAKFFSFTWKFGEFLCKSVHYLQNVSVICSVLTLTVMSMERYVNTSLLFSVIKSRISTCRIQCEVLTTLPILSS